MATNWAVFPEDSTPPKPVVGARRAGRPRRRPRAGGLPGAGRRTPGSSSPSCRSSRSSPRPYQRDLSPPHAKRLQEVIKKLDRFVDPIVVVSPGPGVYWTPNGNHRRNALTKLKAEWMPAILVPEPEVAYQILALNTEKAHNLKEKSLEVIRMYRGLVEEGPKATEEDYAFQFEAPHFITLGLLYEAQQALRGRRVRADPPPRRQVPEGPLPKAYAEREERAELVRAADDALAEVVAKLKKRGINHPYVKNYVLARTTPLTRARKTLPSFEQTFERLRENLEAFDPAKVRLDEIARAAVFAAPA